MNVHAILIFLLVLFGYVNATNEGSFKRLSPVISQYRSTLNTDGSYSQCATLSNRLRFVNLHAHQMTWRHLWNYMSILVLALDTLNPSQFAVARWKNDLGIMLGRLRRLHLPGITDAYDYQVDYQMIMMVHHHLQKLLLPTNTMTSYHMHHPTFDQFVGQRVMGTSMMFHSLFEFWQAPKVVIQLLARSYLPYMYLLHMVHDANQVYDYELLTTFYSPIHQCIVDSDAFLVIGEREDFEVVLTFVDSNLME